MSLELNLSAAIIGDWNTESKQQTLNASFYVTWSENELWKGPWEYLISFCYLSY